MACVSVLILPVESYCTKTIIEGNVLARTKINQFISLMELELTFFGTN